MEIKTILLIAVFLLYIPITMISASIIIEDADTIWNTTTPFSEDLTNVTSNVTPRILTEYANTIYRNNLNHSTGLINVTSNVTPRIMAEYANTIYRNDLDEIPADLANLTDEAPPKRLIIEHANSNYYEKLIFPKELINDTTPPIITNVTVTEITNNSATIKWDTDEIADSLVKYGKVSGVYTKSEENSLFVKKHTIELTMGLLPGTCYYFVVNSTDQSGNSNESIEYNFITTGELKIFDTRAPENPYPSIAGTHYGTITPNRTITVNKLYTYPCPGTGGHTEYARIWNKTWNATATWNGYVDDWHNISFNNPVVLLSNETYNYTIRTGSYPQIHHNKTLTVPDGEITCTKFIDANGRVYYDWIPAIKLS